MSRPALYCELGINWFTGCRGGLPCQEWCWARRMANRLRGRCGYPEDEPFRPTFHQEVFERPLPKARKTIALNFMGDWAFASDEQKQAMLDRMEAEWRHRFLTLTKWPAEFHRFTMPPNCWFGVSASTNADLARQLRWARDVFTHRFWLSLEPLLEAPDLKAIADAIYEGRSPDWVVVGCRSGPGARWSWGHPYGSREHAVHQWTRSVVNICKAIGIPVWVKQLPVLRQGRWRVSDEPADWPADLRIQETPWKRQKGGSDERGRRGRA